MSVKPTAVLVAALLSGLSCQLRPDAPPGVRSLRHQRRRATIVLPTWNVDVAEEVASDAARYAGKALVIQHAYLDPTRSVRIANGAATFPLRGGGVATIQADALPAWLKGWTAAPLLIHARLHPPRPSVAGAADGPLLAARSIDFAHPLELAFVAVERAKDGAWATAHIENYRGEPASATFDLRFGKQRATAAVGPVPPGKAVQQRLQLYAGEEPDWRDWPPDTRRLTLRFADGATVDVDLGQWLDDPGEPLLDWGYQFTPPATALLCLSADRPDAELERFAALELRSYLQQFTDANIGPREPDAAEPLPPGIPLLVVGTAAQNPVAAALVLSARLEGRLKTLGAEGYLLRRLSHQGRPALLVTANSPRGIMHGAYGLLEHYGMRFTMQGARLPARGTLRLVDVDEARTPLFAQRRLVATGRPPLGTSRWSQYRWLTLFDLAAKNRYNQVVFPLDGLDATFDYAQGESRSAVFPFDVGPHTCLAEAYLAHQRGLCVLAAYAHRRGLDVTFARRDAKGVLHSVAPPGCLGPVAAGTTGERIDVLEDPGDRFAMPRVDEAAEAGARLLRQKATELSVPYSRGSTSRASFLAKLAWDASLTPKAYWRSWAATLAKGDAVDDLANAMLAVDKLDSDLLAALPEPLGLGPALAAPLEEADLACDWAALKARATQPAMLKQNEALKKQVRQLRDVARRLEPIQKTVQAALRSVAPPWEDPLFESATATSRAHRIVSAFYRFRGLVGGLASAQEGALGTHAALAEPAQALPRLLMAAGKVETAQRLVSQTAERMRGTSYEAVFDPLVGALAEQQTRLAAWLGPLDGATPVARLRVQGSDAVVHLFRKDRTDIYAAYKLAGEEVVQLRLRATSARVIQRGQAPKTVRAEGGAFLVSLNTVPTFIIARRAAWPGQP